ncbi:restriction endonuclease [Ramlibacter sp.]|uniref:restriction endonuclease n=1 Tax=Ramlibacter sp. TaxID=1917967 RepID=UPI003D0D9F58
MPVPTYDNFIEPILRFLVKHPQGADAKAAHESAASSLGLTPEDREQQLQSNGQLVYKNRAGWAHDRLKRAGLSSSPKRGWWKATDEGIAFAMQHPAPFNTELIEKLALGFLSVKLKPESSFSTVGPDPAPPPAAPPSAMISPDDRLSQALTELRQSAASELLEVLGHVSPGFFETIVLDLLHRMGYGGSRSDLQQVGGSGDAGIDGIISLDKLGLEKVYVQAKRWQSSVGRPDLQAFYGALAGQKARKGVFITTSAFTAHAAEFARSVDGIVLIDGVRLAELMIDHEVGVTSQAVKIPKLDSDYFDEEGV